MKTYLKWAVLLGAVALPFVAGADEVVQKGDQFVIVSDKAFLHMRKSMLPQPVIAPAMTAPAKPVAALPPGREKPSPINPSDYPRLNITIN